MISIESDLMFVNIDLKGQSLGNCRKLADVPNNSLTAVKVDEAVVLRMKDGESIDHATLETVIYYIFLKC